MQNREISRQLQRLESLIARADEATNRNIEMQSHWAKYICILSAGVIENALKELYIDYATSKVSKPLATYVSSHISRTNNPKIEVFIKFASVFNETWKDELIGFADDRGRGDAIDSIMTNRHQIAHGKAHISNITLAQVKDYLKKAIEVLEFIEAQCKR